MPVVFSAVFAVIFGIGVWHARKGESRRVTLSGIVDLSVKALGLCAVLIGVGSIVLMLVASSFRLF
jgi:hypothetical protein